MKRAEELEPLVPLFPADLAWQYFEQGQIDAALAAARRSLELNPNFAEGLAVAGWIYTPRRMYDEALAAHQKAAGADPAWKWPLGRTYALLGRRDEARMIAAEMAQQPGPMEQWGLAVIYAALGEKDEAFRWLEAAYKSRFSWMPWLADFSRLDVDLFTPLRRDPRFAELTRRIGVPEPSRSRVIGATLDSDAAFTTRFPETGRRGRRAPRCPLAAQHRLHPRRRPRLRRPELPQPGIQNPHAEPRPPGARRRDLHRRP